MVNLTLHNILRGVQEPFQEASSSSAMDSMHLEAHLSCQCGVSLNGEFCSAKFSIQRHFPSSAILAKTQRLTLKG